MPHSQTEKLNSTTSLDNIIQKLNLHLGLDIYIYTFRFSTTEFWSYDCSSQL